MFISTTSSAENDDVDDVVVQFGSGRQDVDAMLIFLEIRKYEDTTTTATNSCTRLTVATFGNNSEIIRIFRGD